MSPLSAGPCEEPLSFAAALEQVRPFFQPLVSLQKRRIVGYEALARGPQGTPWESPAGLFAEAAARSLTGLLGCRIWKAAMQVWEARFPQPMLCLNAHPGFGCRFDRPDCLTCPLPRLLLSERLGQIGRLVVEVPERLLLPQSADARRHVEQWRAAGIRLWLDDLGSGVAGLQFLLLWRPDGFKLDRLLVANLDTDPYRQAVVRALVGIARDLGVALVAEGVETEAELACLAELGVDLAQGFALGRPSPQPQPLAPELAARLARLPLPSRQGPPVPLPPPVSGHEGAAVWGDLEALSRAVRKAPSTREALGHVGRALAGQLAGDGVLLLDGPADAGLACPPGPGDGVAVVVLDGVLWPPVTELGQGVLPGRVKLPPPGKPPGPCFHPDLHLPDPLWEPVYLLGARLGFSSLLTIPAPCGGLPAPTWVVGWRRPVRLDPQALAAAAVLADYTALAGCGRGRKGSSPSDKGVEEEGRPTG